MTEELTDETQDKEQKVEISPNTQMMAETLKRLFGNDLSAILCGVSPTVLRDWALGKKKPGEYQAKVLFSAYSISEVLLSSVSIKDTKLWLVSHSPYLYGVPAVELRKRPGDVLLAAQNRVVRGENEEYVD